MSVVLSFEICESSSCNSLIFKETTGVFNIFTNPNGWGNPNEETSAATAAVLTIELASGSITTIDLFATGFFPTSDPTFEFLINGSDIGYPEQILDQVIKFTYTVTTATTTYTQTIYKALYCQVKCCVNKMFLDLDFSCDCIDDKLNTALKAYGMYRGLVSAADCGNITNFNNILSQLNKICSGLSCSSCK